MNEVNLKGLGKKIKVAGIEGNWGGFKEDKILLITGIEQGKANYLIFSRVKGEYRTIKGGDYSFKINLSEKPQELSERIVRGIWNNYLHGENNETTAEYFGGNLK